MASDRLVLPLLSYLSAAAALVPALPSLPTATRLFLLVACGGAVYCDRQERRLPAWLLTTAAIAGTVAAFSRFTWADPIISFLNISSVLLAVRLLAEKNRRTYLQLFMLTLFTLAALSIIRLDVLYFVAAMVLLTSGMTALVILTAREFSVAATGQPAITGRLIMVSLILAAAALPLLLIFFLVLPRTQMPLWRFIPAVTVAPGFSEQVQPGRSSSQQLSRRLAFRADVPAELPPEQLYWRVTVLSRFTGTSWERALPEHPMEPLKGGNRKEIAQTIYLEAGLGRFLVGLEHPVTINGQRFALQSDGVVTSPGAGTGRLRYQVLSWPTAARTAPRDLPTTYRELPAAAPPRLVTLGRDIRQRLPEPAARLQEIESLFLRQRLQYATTGMATSDAPLDDFFFSLRRGNCEFFASAAAILLRAAGIPARLVGGYLGGDFYPVGSFYTITDERAHVWVEALLDGRWQRIDPSRWAVNGADLGRPAQRSLATRLHAIATVLDYYWTRTVVSYDFQQQLATADQLGQTLSAFKRPAVARRLLSWAGVGLLLAAIAFAATRLRLLNREKRLLRVIADRLGPELRCPATCLLDAARRSGNRRVRRAVELYCATVYRGRCLTPLRDRRLRKLLAG